MQKESSHLKGEDSVTMEESESRLAMDWRWSVLKQVAGGERKFEAVARLFLFDVDR